MKINQLMSSSVTTCGPDDSLSDAAGLMWDHDLGFLPVVDASWQVVGVVTDRDIAMGAYLDGRALRHVPVANVMARKVISCTADTTLEAAEELMKAARIHRLPVVEDGRLVGVASLNDIARAASNPKLREGLHLEDVARVLATVSAPRQRISRNARV